MTTLFESSIALNLHSKLVDSNVIRIPKGKGPFISAIVELLANLAKSYRNGMVSLSPNNMAAFWDVVRDKVSHVYKRLRGAVLKSLSCDVSISDLRNKMIGF